MAGGFEITRMFAQRFQQSVAVTYDMVLLRYDRYMSYGTYGYGLK